MSVELKPCPKCKRGMYLFLFDEQEWKVGCENCRIIFRDYGGKDLNDVIKRWNEKGVINNER